MLTFACMSAQTWSLLCEAFADDGAPRDGFIGVHAALVDRFEMRLKQVNPQYESLQYDISDLVSRCNAMLCIGTPAWCHSYADECMVCV